MGEPLGAVGSIAGLVSLAIQISQLSFQYISGVSGSSRAWSSYIQELSTLTSVLLKLQQASEHASAQDIPHMLPALGVSSATIKDCHKELDSLKLTLSAKLAQRSLRRKLEMLSWPFSEPETQRKVEMLHRFSSQFGFSLAADNLTVSVESYLHLQDEKSLKKFNELLDWFKPAYESLPLSPEVLLEPMCPGTRSTLLSSGAYVNWRDALGTALPQPLWIFGPPGAGKSVISAAIVDDISCHTDATVAYHFFRDSLEETLQDVLRHIAHQLLSLPRTQSQVAMDIYGKKKARSASLLLKDLVDVICDICTTSDQVFIILDGVDEFPQCNKLLKHLPQFIAAHGKIVVSSRDLPSIRIHLNNATLLDARVEHQDIEKYVQWRLEEESEIDEDLLTGDLKSDIVVKLSERTDGSFLLTRLIMDSICSATTIKKIRNMLDSIPTNYGQAYRDTFDRITRQSPDRKRLALSALIWICYAKRALGMTELRHAISSMDENPQYDSECLEPATAILSSCYGLIVYSKSSQTVDMVHSSARSFLLEQLKVYSENPNIIIGRACMNYMAVPEMGKGPCQTLDQLKARVTEMPFLDYATRYYGYHICPVEDALLPELLHFLENGQFRESSWQLLHFVINIESESAQDLITSVPSHATLLHVSCYWDFSSSVRKLLATPSGLEMLNQADSHGWTPLHWASSNGHSQLVTNLLDAGATIDTIDQAFWTPLFWAVMRGHDAVARLLLERGSSPFDQDQTCLTPVHWAILTGNTEIAEMLLDNAIHSPLRYQSANHGLTTPINQLTVEGAKAAFHPPQTKNLFQLAAEISDTERFQKLARKYGDFFSINKIGFDTWNINEMWDTSKIVFSKADISFWRRLRDKAPVDGVRIEILTKAIQCEDVNLVRSILDFSRDMGKDLANEAVSRYESGYVHVAAYSGSAEIMRMFKHAGFPLTATDSRGFTPLHYACRTGTPEVSDVILEAGVDVDALDKERRTPLMLLLQYGIWRTCHKPGDTCAMLNALVAKGASIHAKDAAGHQPIHYAMSTMDPDIVQLLVDRGADTGAISDDLWTPLHALAAGPIGKFRTRALELEGHLREYKMIRVRADQTRRMMELALRISPSWVIQAETAAKATALALAIKASSWQLAQGLHAANAPFRSKDDLSKALNRVAEHGFYEFTRMLIQAGITAKGTTLLPRMSVMQPAQKPHRWESTLFGIHDYEALPARDYSLVLKELLDLGVDVHQTDSYLRLTPIQLAAERGVQDSAYLATLLEGGADPYAETNEGLDSFDLALLCGKLDNLAILVQHAARDLSRDNWLANWLRESRTVPQGDQDCFNACLAAIRHSGRHASYIKNGHTLLFYAAREGNLVLTDELINLGAKVGLRDPLGWTPFHEAVRNHRVDVVEFLISKGANVLWTVDDTLPFSESTRRPNPDEPTPIINALHIVVGIHPHWLSVEDRNRLTPNIVRLLLENGIDPNGKALNVGSCRENSGGNLMYDLRTVDGSASPLQILFRKSGPKHPEEFFAIVQLLIDFGADVRGIAEKMDIWDVALFEGYEHLWDLFRSAEPVS